MEKNFSNIIRSPQTKYIGMGVFAISASAGIFYIFRAKKRKVAFKNSENDMINEENEPNQLTIFDYSPGEPDFVEHLEFTAEAPEEPEEVTKVHIFKNRDDDWDYELEMSTRTKDNPYVIHRDEFVSSEIGYDQSTITYYRGDDIMADINDVPIYNYASMVGELKFGHGSGDPNVVYIRNEKLEMEWEILLHGGRFEVEVLGYDVESRYEKENLAHSHSVLKFRDV